MSRRAYLFIALAVAACGGAPPHARDILFQAQLPGDTEDIYTMRFADGVTRRLTRADPAFANSYPVWSPEGNRIAFVREFGDSSQLYVLDSAGAEPRRLSTPGVPILSWPDWSPDGATILIPAGSDWAHMSLYRIREDGTDLQRLPTGSGNYSCGSWAPDGHRVVASRDGAASRSEVVEIEIGSGRTRVLASTDSAELGCPDWSPDGKSILVSVYHGTTAQRELADSAFADLALLDMSTGQLRALTHGPGVNNHGRWDHTGEWIIFQSTPHPGAGRDTAARRRFFTTLEIHVIRPDGTGRRRLTENDYFDAHPSW